MSVDAAKSFPGNTSTSSGWSRRTFLRSLLFGGMALELRSVWSPCLYGDDTRQSASKGLVVHSDKPLNAEPSLEELVAHWITPVESFYIRNHGDTPQIDAQEFELAIEGLVDNPVSYSIGELVERFPKVSTTATLTCAGNRRSEFTGPKISGVPWRAAAIGNAHWSGVSLKALLRHAGLQPGAKHVWFEGSDVIAGKGETYPFGGSIPLEKALSGDDRSPQPLLASTMNDKPLTPEHGFPLRAVVPGYIGARSVKWLKKIVVSDRPSPNHYLADAYKVVTEETAESLQAAAPLYEYTINSVICRPSRDSRIKPGKIQVQGFALPEGAAGRSIRQIEVSADGGKSWTNARTASEVKEFCWILWSAELEVTAQTERLLARSRDSGGATQPREMPWNIKGYQYNAWHQVPLQLN